MPKPISPFVSYRRPGRAFWEKRRLQGDLEWLRRYTEYMLGAAPGGPSTVAGMRELLELHKPAGVTVEACLRDLLYVEATRAT